MDQIEPGLGRLVPVCMELPLHNDRWVDNLFITPEGHLVVVEVKLWRNSEAHRKVVAQALEYATALFKFSYDDLEAAVSKADFNGAERPENSTAWSAGRMRHRNACSRAVFRAICARGGLSY